MVVDVGFTGKGRIINPVGARHQNAARVQRAQPAISSDARKLYDRISEVNKRANSYKFKLDAALSALSDANAEIDRLGEEQKASEIEMRHLNAEICRLRQELDRARAKKPKNRKTDIPEPADEAPATDTVDPA